MEPPQPSSSSPSTSFVVPVDRVIQTEAHIGQWHNSKAFHLLWAFVTKCNEAVMGKRQSDAGQGSPIIGHLVHMLDVRSVHEKAAIVVWCTRRASH